ncbi:MAG: hypothetical protein ACQERB_03325 [Promethearchaeati archaeon]
MPEGLLIMQWNDRSGIEVIDQYPEAIEEKISTKTLLQIYNMHQYSRKKGVAWLNLESINFVSYYSGPQKNFFLVLLLNILEDPEDYEEKLELYAEKLLNAIKTERYEHNFLKILQNFKLN